jgi:uncharacterized protein YmfQ (DUF2313 family)
MGIAVAAGTQYENAIKKLFPRGAYWDKQFADPDSDVSLFVKAKLDELISFRGRISDLQDESRAETTDELIADWERVLLGKVTYGKTLEERRLFLVSKEINKPSRAELQKTAELYGLTIIDITFPYRPAFFGHAFCNTSFLGGPVCFSAPLVTASWDIKKFWNLFTAGHSVQQFGVTRFGLERLAWLPADRLRYYLGKTIRAASAGFFKTGVQRLFPSPACKIRPVVESRLRAASAGFARFGVNRLVCSPVPAARRIAARRVREGSAGFTRTGIDRLMYTSTREIQKAVRGRLRSVSAGFARCGQGRLMPMPFYETGVLLQTRFRSVSFRAVKFGLSRLAHYNGGFSAFLVRDDAWLFSGFVKTAIQTSGVISRTDALIVNAISGDSGFPRKFGIALTREIILRSGLLPEFDGYFTRLLIRENKFFPRLEKAFINHLAREKKLFCDFERAVQNRLPANQIPYFDYQGA